MIVTNTPDGVRRPVATSVLTFILALTHKLFAKDRLTRAGRWDRDSTHGHGLTGRTLGLDRRSATSAARSFRLLQPFEHAACSRSTPTSRPRRRALGVELVDLETLLRQSDFVCVSCPLRRDAQAGRRPRLGLMKPTAYLINTARGPIVDETALHRALRARHGSPAPALDVFEQEPTPAGQPAARGSRTSS